MRICFEMKMADSAMIYLNFDSSEGCHLSEYIIM